MLCQLLTDAILSHEMIPMETGVTCPSMNQSPLGSWGGTETLGLNGLYPFQRGSVYHFFLSRLAPATFPLSSSKGEAELLGRGPGSGASRQFQRHWVMAALCLHLLPKNVDFPGCPG